MRSPGLFLLVRSPWFQRFALSLNPICYIPEPRSYFDDQLDSSQELSWHRIILSMLFQFIAVAVALAIAFVPSTILGGIKANSTCRYLPGDEEWPPLEQWTQLNASVAGRLITTVPAGHVCHDPTYDEVACTALRESWSFPQTQYVV